MLARLLGSLSIALSLLTTAYAADLPSRAAPPVFVPPPAPTWTGFYLGAEAGYGFGDTKFSFPGSTLPFGVPNRFDGFVGGGTLGYNKQFNQLVLGVETDFSYSGMKGTRQTAFTPAPATPCLTPGQGCSTKVDWFGTARGRIGLASGPFLFYGTGGLAYGKIKGSVDQGACPGCSISDTKVGWTVGGGAEWAFYDHWSAKVEYLYADLGRPSITGVNLAPVRTFDYHVNLVRAGLNYRFGFDPAPVVARY